MTINTERTNIGWNFWLAWVTVNSLGLSIGSFVSEALDTPMSGSLLFGAVLGTLQWLVLRHYLAQSGLWVLASIGGWAVGGVAALSVQRSGGSIEAIRGAGGFTGVAVAGILQWLVLRRQVARAGWWIFASIGSLLAAGIVIGDFNPLAGTYAVEGGIFEDLVARAVVRILPGAAMGTINGAMMAWLLNQPAAESERRMVST